MNPSPPLMLRILAAPPNGCCVLTQHDMETSSRVFKEVPEAISYSRYDSVATHW
jgi:hypothetical protein